MKNCLYCGKELIQAQRHNIYCSNECANAAKFNNKVQAWLNGEYDGTIKNGVISSTIKRYLLQQANYKCSVCGWGEVNPVTGKVPLEIHHIDGNYLNNSIENLQVLCPNCHSLTSNYKALNKFENTRIRAASSRKRYCVDCGKEITEDALRCKACAGKQRITEKPVTRDELKKLIRTKPFTQIGKQFGVTDNAIKKWCLRYNLPSKKKDINNISDKDWELI